MSEENTAPATESAAPESTPTAEAPGAPSGPWANDLTTRFEDEAIRGQVDEFLRTTVQPYVTQLEQRTSNLDAAAELYNELQESPAATYLALTEELFGAEAVDPIREQLIAIYSDPEPGEDDPAQTPEEREHEQELKQELPPEVQEIVAEHQERKRQQLYNAELERIKGAHPDAQIDDTLFAPFVVSAEGDFDAAFEAYERWRQTAGIAAPPAPTTDEPPPVVNSATSTTTTPPTAKEYKSIDEALDDFFAEQKSGPPPVVGAT